MSREEKEFWAARDPIPAFEKTLADAKVLDSAKAAEIKKSVEAEVQAAIEFAQNSPDPKPEDAYNDLYLTMEVPR
jgi:TPP-dependent pyruvate/acetoin dehydrogenase alpha subunit